MKRAIVWHCECGRDFETETELRQDRCPHCDGTDIERVKVPSRWSKLFGDTDKNSKQKYWR